VAYHETRREDVVTKGGLSRNPHQRVTQLERPGWHFCRPPWSVGRYGKWKSTLLRKMRAAVRQRAQRGSRA